MGKEKKYCREKQQHRLNFTCLLKRGIMYISSTCNDEQKTRAARRLTQDVPQYPYQARNASAMARLLMRKSMRSTCTTLWRK